MRIIEGNKEIKLTYEQLVERVKNEINPNKINQMTTFLAITIVQELHDEIAFEDLTFEELKNIIKDKLYQKNLL